MECKAGADAPATRNSVDNVVSAAELAAVTKGEIIGHIAIEVCRQVLRTPAVVTALVVGILGESPARNGLSFERNIIAKLAEEAGRVAQTFRPGKVQLGLQTTGKTLLKHSLQSMIVGNAI